MLFLQSTLWPLSQHSHHKIRINKTNNSSNNNKLWKWGVLMSGATLYRILYAILVPTLGYLMSEQVAAQITGIFILRCPRVLLSRKTGRSSVCNYEIIPFTCPMDVAFRNVIHMAWTNKSKKKFIGQWRPYQLT
jgi:hypothetical protein